MRTYEPIWARLKALPIIFKNNVPSTEGISITAPVFLHARIIKAVIKEKWQDVGYKITLWETQQRKATLWYKRQTSVITFYLTFTPSVHDFASQEEASKVLGSDKSGLESY